MAQYVPMTIDQARAIIASENNAIETESKTLSLFKGMVVHLDNGATLRRLSAHRNEYELKAAA